MLLLGNAVVDDRPLTVHTDMVLVARAMSRPDSGLEIRDRLWLKITVPRAFIGQYSLITLSLTETKDFRLHFRNFLTCFLSSSLVFS